MRTKREYVLILWQGLNVSFYFHAISWKHNHIILPCRPLRAKNVLCFVQTISVSCNMQYTHALKLLFWFTHSLLKYLLKLSRKALSCSKLRKKEIRERVLLWHALMKSIMSSLFWFKFSKISFQKIVKVSVELLGYIYLQCSPCLLFAQ